MAKKKTPAAAHPVAQAIQNIAGQIFRERVTFQVRGLEVFVNPNKKTALIVRKAVGK